MSSSNAANKGLTEEQAREMTANRLYFANLMLKPRPVDGLVAGSIASTPDMLRSASHCVGTAKGSNWPAAALSWT